MTRVLVTGGAGFIGSHLVARLDADGVEVLVLDNLSTGSLDNLAGLNYQFFEGDIADFDILKRAAAGCDLIFHQAAMVSVPQSLAHPDLNHRSNIIGNSNLFEAARQAGVGRVVYASSAAVYGNRPGLPKKENDSTESLTPYSAGKLFSEILGQTYLNAYGLESVGLRYMNVFGPRQDPSSPYSGVLSIFCQAALNDGVCKVFGDGEQTRDFIYVEDVVQANLKAAFAPANQLGDNYIFNIGRGEQTSLNHILRVLGELTGKAINVIYMEERHGDIRHSVADISAARKVLKFDPQVTIKEGLKQTLLSMT
ncbi:MAG: NAD-dependent epimerase/dehydratase family protein [Ardenticatenaceae bacterium]|nr:NAD-dependent epimerase/dehydratase family protein [Ardenticatenaceae bacterium]